MSTLQMDDPFALLAGALAEISDEPDDHESLDFREGLWRSAETDEEFHKVPLEEADNLIKFREAVSGLQNGRLSREKFLSILRPYLQRGQDALGLLNSEVILSQVRDSSEDEQLLFEETAIQLKAIFEGLQRLYRAGQNRTLSELTSCLEAVEQAYQTLDEIQDDLIDVGQELLLREQATSCLN